MLAVRIALSLEWLPVGGGGATMEVLCQALSHTPQLQSHKPSVWPLCGTCGAHDG